MSQNLESKLKQDLMAAMKSGDEIRKRTIRSLRAAIQSSEMEAVRLHELELGHALDDERILGILHKQAKQRRDSIAQFVQGAREDLAEEERAELAIIESYLPRQMTEAEIEEAVRAQIERVGATGPSDMGKVMGPLMQSLAGVADGKQVSAAVRRLLAG